MNLTNLTMSTESSNIQITNIYNYIYTCHNDNTLQFNTFDNPENNQSLKMAGIKIKNRKMYLGKEYIGYIKIGLNYSIVPSIKTIYQLYFNKSFILAYTKAN